jgi:alpha-1,3-rhamnosyl/mannosyltransferase
VSFRVGIDLTALMPVATGVDNYLTGLVRSLALVDRENHYVLFVNRQDAARFADLGERFEMLPLCTRARALRLVFQQLVLPRAARSFRLDVLHSPSFFMPLRRGQVRHLLTVHDLTSFSRPHEHNALRRSPFYRWGIRESVRRADLIVVPSSFVKAELLRRWPFVSDTCVRVIAEGVADEFHSAAPRRLSWPAPYLLFVGTLEPRKNLGVLLSAYERLARAGRPEHLLLAGKRGWGCGRLLKRLRAPGLAGRVHHLGYVAQAELPSLYAGASVFVYPSREEGFGLPPLEAMACGAPTVASLGSALEANLAGAAELVDTARPEPLAAALLRVLQDEARREELILAGRRRAGQFRWELSARETARCYSELADC